MQWERTRAQTSTPRILGPLVDCLLLPSLVSSHVVAHQPAPRKAAHDRPLPLLHDRAPRSPWQGLGLCRRGGRGHQEREHGPVGRLWTLRDGRSVALGSCTRRELTRRCSETIIGAIARRADLKGLTGVSNNAGAGDGGLGTCIMQARSVRSSRANGEAPSSPDQEQADFQDDSLLHRVEQGPRDGLPVGRGRAGAHTTGHAGREDQLRWEGHPR